MLRLTKSRTPGQGLWGLLGSKRALDWKQSAHQSLPLSKQLFVTRRLLRALDPSGFAVPNREGNFSFVIDYPRSVMRMVDQAQVLEAKNEVVASIA
jgi:hypothetical protein